MDEQRLIDANALKELVIKEIHKYWNCDGSGYYLAEDVITDIDNAPTVDAVEVVRCKGCVYAKLNLRTEYRETFKCKNLNSGFFDWIMSDDEFCCLGKRRTDNG